MVRIRKLQRKGADNVWHSDAYAVEMRDGSTALRYSLAWEHLGARYNRAIQEQGISLEQLEDVLAGESVRWTPVEIFETDEKVVIAALDQECNVPSANAGQRANRRATPKLITLQARVVRGRLQFQTAPASPIRVSGDHIYLEDGRQLQITLAQG